MSIKSFTGTLGFGTKQTFQDSKYSSSDALENGICRCTVVWSSNFKSTLCVYIYMSVYVSDAKTTKRFQTSSEV